MTKTQKTVKSLRADAKYYAAAVVIAGTAVLPFVAIVKNK